MPEATDTIRAYLECYSQLYQKSVRIPIKTLPFRLGRSPTADHAILGTRVSKEHAVITRNDDNTYQVRDLGSTNGTFVNGRQIQDSPLADGDILHVADHEFRFVIVRADSSDPNVDTDTKSLAGPVLPGLLASGDALHELLQRRAVTVHFQPIVDLRTSSLIGHEALGRGNHEALPQKPSELFHIAEQLHLASELNRMLTVAAALACREFRFGELIFLNMHPIDLSPAGLAETLEGIRSHSPPGRRYVVEISEAAVTEARSVKEIRSVLTNYGMQLAYDDFGAGQSRLLEVVTVPPDFIKLDRTLIKGVHRDTGRQDLIGTLVDLCTRRNVRVIAEGIECDEEALTCRRLGCHLGQGYFFGRPKPVSVDVTDAVEWVV